MRGIVAGDDVGAATKAALYAELAEKAATRPEGSRTVAELDSGVHGIGKKIVEEAAEVWMAAEYESKEELAEEISQLLYWTQVLMLSRGLTLADVYGKLCSRPCRSLNGPIGCASRFAVIFRTPFVTLIASMT